MSLMAEWLKQASHGHEMYIMSSRSWVRKLVGLNLGCIDLLSKLDLNQTYKSFLWPLLFVSFLLTLLDGQFTNDLIRSDSLLTLKVSAWSHYHWFPWFCVYSQRGPGLQLNYRIVCINILFITRHDKGSRRAKSYVLPPPFSCCHLVVNVYINLYTYP